MDNLDDIEAQIAELQKRKAELLLEKAKEEEAKKLADMKDIVISISKYSASQVYFESSEYRSDISNILIYTPENIRLVANKFVIPIKEYYKTRDKILNELTKVTFKIDQKTSEYIEYYLNGPHAEIKWNDKDITIRVHPNISYYNIFKEMAGSIARMQADSLYHLPKNELYRLLKIYNTYTAGKWTWDDKSLAYATKDLEDRKLLDDIALAEDAPEYNIKFKLGQELRPFQRVGIKFGVTTKQTIGKGFVKVLIADPMGLGKTWQALGICEQTGAKKIAIICPASVKENWVREIFNLTGHRAKVMVGTQPNTEDLHDLIDPNKKYYIFNYDILSRPIKDEKETNGMYESSERYLWIEAINSLLIDTIVVDEAHKAKNVDAGRTKAILKLKVPNVILLTGTPVINRPLELWPGLHLLNKEVFNNRDGFEARYSAGNYGVRNVEELRDLLRPYMIRRKISDVQKELPPIIRTTQHVEMSEKERMAYSKMLLSIIVSLNEENYGEEIGYINHILVKILRLKQFLSKIKTQAVADYALDIYDQAEADDPHKKVIIFSQFVPIVMRLSRLLGNESRYIIGAEHSPLDRQLIVDEFQKNPRVQFLIATPQSTSEGLNITAAGHVIFCDYMWTPAIHQQAEGRAYGRLSDSHTIEAHYFAVLNSLDDWLRGIILAKMQTIEAVVEGVNEQRVQEGSIIKELIRALKNGELK